MPKKKHSTTEEELDEKLEELVEEIADSTTTTVVTTDQYRREELIKASEDGYIDKKVSALKKATEKSIDKLYEEYLAKRRKDADVFLTDPIISQFANVLGGLDAIESPENLIDDLKTNILLKKDIENMVSLISPYIPIIGIISGVATTGKHIYQ